ncbi:MAG: polysaccharide deacetylase family protein [Hominisplanchenecus sp.]
MAREKGRHCILFLVLIAVCCLIWQKDLQTVRAAETTAETGTGDTPQSETTQPSAPVVLQNVKKAPKLNGKWVRRDGKVYFRRKDKTFAVSTWAQIKGKYYYFNEQGIRVAGFLKYQNGKAYYLGTDGAMVTGWQKIRKYYYYFGKKGAMKTSSWVKTNGKYYYVNAKGRRVKKRWVTVDGKKYYLDEDGVRVTESRYVGKKACYFDKNGVYHPEKKVTGRLIDPKKKMVVLTFDDGPGPYTDRLLKCLKQNNAVATFFLVGSSVSNYRNTVKTMYQMGCEIGNHSWDHPQLSSLSASGIRSQIERTNAQIRGITGQDATLLRPPYGAYNSTVAANAGMPLILWSIDTLDWKTRNAQNTIQVVMNEVRDGSIVLMHDIHSPSVDAAEVLIPRLIQAGYQLVTVSELAKYRGTVMRDGGVYASF